MTKMEKVINDISDLYDFYMNLVRTKGKIPIESIENSQNEEKLASKETKS